MTSLVSKTSQGQVPLVQRPWAGSSEVFAQTQGIKARAKVGDALVRQLHVNSTTLSDDEADRSFFVADLGEIYRCYLKWKRLLPRVVPFYAVKCNPEHAVLNLLHKLGLGFDCASKVEMQQVLSLGTPSERIIYAHPCKASSHIKFARSAGVTKMTFDNADELYKIKEDFPDADLVLRIATCDARSLAPMSHKFGATMNTTRDLLELANTLSLNVIGVSFHIGSGARDSSAFEQALKDARLVFEQGQELGFSMQLLDVGGGFGIDSFETMANDLRRMLDTYFPPEDGVRIIAEPGRYFVASAFTLACKVIGRKVISPHEVKLYVNDGVYSNFMCAVTDHDTFTPRVLYTRGQIWYDDRGADLPKGDASLQVSHSVWGQTCDGVDCINREVKFDMGLEVGDWLYFERMGAYTSCSTTSFNGFPSAQNITILQNEL